MTVGFDKREYGTHSLRRTKVSLIYKATRNLRAVQILLGHSSFENTVHYLVSISTMPLPYPSALKSEPRTGSAIILGRRFANMK